MKKCFAFALLLLCATPVFPQDSGSPAAAGTIIPGRDGATGIYGRQSVLSPDGSKIAYAYGDSIFLVSTRGGTPEGVFSSVYRYTSPDGESFSISRRIESLAGFSADGVMLYFEMYDPEPSSIKITTDGMGNRTAHASEVFPCVQRLDVTNGAMVTAFSRASLYAVSPGNRYMIYKPEGTSPLRVKELSGSGDWDLASSAYVPFIFTSDGQNILHLNSSGELYKIPLQGGDPVRMPFPVIQNCSLMDCSPDGKWALCRELGDPEPYSYLHDVFDDEGKYIYTQSRKGDYSPVTISAINLSSGQRVVLLPPEEAVLIGKAVFFPDGKRIFYPRYDLKDFAYSDYVLTTMDISLPAPSSVADAVPKGFALTGHYPNPFNPSTRIAFTLPSAGTARLSVYDVTGRMVRNLVSSALVAGSHEMVWDGCDESGMAVSSGTYIARLKMGNLTASHRMTLMK